MGLMRFTAKVIMNKYCYRCRAYKPRDDFDILRKGSEYKLTRTCKTCLIEKTALRSKHARHVRIFRKCPLRNRELLLIPDPFKRNAIKVDDVHHLAWSETV
jgi:hypothetical protein